MSLFAILPLTSPSRKSGFATMYCTISKSPRVHPLTSPSSLCLQSFSSLLYTGAMIAKKQPYEIKQVPSSKRLAHIYKESGRIIREEEYAIAKVLAKFGKDILFLKESKLAKQSTPDCEWDNNLWEIKTLFGNSTNNTIEALRSGKQQSKNIIISKLFTKRNINRICHDVVSYLNTHNHAKISRVLIISEKQYCLISKDLLK